MDFTDAAYERLQDLLPEDARGFRVEGWVGTCRGSTPVLQPASQARDNEVEIRKKNLIFFANKDQVDILQSAALDYEPGLFGRGLRMSWPHQDGCACQNP